MKLNKTKIRSILFSIVCLLAIVLSITAMVFGMLYCSSLQNLNVADAIQVENTLFNLVSPNILPFQDFLGCSTNVDGKLIIPSFGYSNAYGSISFNSNFMLNKFLVNSIRYNGWTPVLKFHHIDLKAIDFLPLQSLYPYELIVHDDNGVINFLTNTWLNFSVVVSNTSDMTLNINLKGLIYFDGGTSGPGDSTVAISPNTTRTLFCEIPIHGTNTYDKLSSLQFDFILESPPSNQTFEVYNVQAWVSSLPCTGSLQNVRRVNNNYVSSYYLNNKDATSGNYQDGYGTGFIDGKNEGYKLGNDAGLADGYKQGEQAGYQQGKTDGYKQGVEGKNTFSDLANSIVMVPVQGITSLFNFELFGFNVADLVLALLTMCIVFGIINLIMARRG